MAMQRLIEFANLHSWLDPSLVRNRSSRLVSLSVSKSFTAMVALPGFRSYNFDPATPHRISRSAQRIAVMASQLATVRYRPSCDEYVEAKGRPGAGSPGGRIGCANRLSGRSLNHVHVDTHGNMWAGTTRGLHVIRGKRTDMLDTEDGLPSVDTLCLHEDEKGTTSVGTNAALVRLAGARCELRTVRRVRLGAASGGPHGACVQPEADCDRRETSDYHLQLEHQDVRHICSRDEG